MAVGLHKNRTNAIVRTDRAPLTKGENRVVAGVCSGIATHFDADNVSVRTTAVVLLICTCGLVVIPYAILAAVLPSPKKEDAPVDIDPLEIRSDRYHQVVGARSVKSKAFAQPAARADSGHVPPAPPTSSTDPLARLRYCAQRHDPLNAPFEERPLRRGPLVLAMVVALCILFAVVASVAVAQIPGSSVLGFWPLLFVVVGTAALACFADKVTFPCRVALLIFCLELCVGALPFTLGIAPSASFARLGDASVVLWFIVCMVLVAAAAFHRSDLLVVAVGIAAIALLVSFYEMGIFARLVAMPSFYRHGLASGLFRP